MGIRRSGLLLQQLFERIAAVAVQTDGLCPDHFRADGFIKVQTGIDRAGIFRRHGPEGIFDNHGRVAAHAELEEQHVLPFVCLKERSVPVRRGMPPGVLHKGLIGAQVHGDRPAAVRADRDQVMGKAHGETPVLRHLEYAVWIQDKALRRHGFSDPVFIVVGLFDAAPGTLEQPVIALRVEEPLLVKAGALEAVVHIGGDHEIVPAPDQREEVMVHGFWRIHVSVDIDVPRPEGPAGLRVGERVEAAGIHIPEAEVLPEIKEIPVEPLAAVGKAGGRGKACASADDDGISALDFLLQAAKIRAAAAGIIGQAGGEAAHKGDALLKRL